MRGIIFDLDGVIVNSMPFHFKAWKKAFREIVAINIDKKFIYMNEGLNGKELIKKVFEIKNIHNYTLINKINSRKKEIFLNFNITPFPYVKKMIYDLDCIKGLVTGSRKEEAERILNNVFIKNPFDIVITGSEIKKSKPDPSGFNLFLKKTSLQNNEVIVVENSPFGVIAANSANLKCILTLNNSILNLSYFEGIINKQNVFNTTKEALHYLKSWCK